MERNKGVNRSWDIFNFCKKPGCQGLFVPLSFHFSTVPSPPASYGMNGSRVLLTGTSLALLGEHIFLSLHIHNELLFLAGVEEGSQQLLAWSASLLSAFCAQHLIKSVARVH